MHFQMKKLSPVARLMITSAALRTLQHVHLKKLMQKRTLKTEADVRSSRKQVVSFASHLKWEYWLLGVATFTNKGSCLEKDVKHGTNYEFLLLNCVQNCLSKKDLHQKWYLAELTVFHMSQALRYDQSEEKEQC